MPPSSTDGEHPETAIAELLADPAVQIHSCVAYAAIACSRSPARSRMPSLQIYELLSTAQTSHGCGREPSWSSVASTG